MPKSTVAGVTFSRAQLGERIRSKVQSGECAILPSVSEKIVAIKSQKKLRGWRSSDEDLAVVAHLDLHRGLVEGRVVDCAPCSDFVSGSAATVKAMTEDGSALTIMVELPEAEGPVLVFDFQLEPPV